MLNDFKDEDFDTKIKMKIFRLCNFRQLGAANVKRSCR